jgi:hypothetical protein
MSEININNIDDVWPIFENAKDDINKLENVSAHFIIKRGFNIENPRITDKNASINGPTTKTNSTCEFHTSGVPLYHNGKIYDIMDIEVDADINNGSKFIIGSDLDILLSGEIIKNLINNKIKKETYLDPVTGNKHVKIHLPILIERE